MIMTGSSADLKNFKGEYGKVDDNNQETREDEERASLSAILIAFLAPDQHPFPPSSWTLAITLLAVQLIPSTVRLRRKKTI